MDALLASAPTTMKCEIDAKTYQALEVIAYYLLESEAEHYEEQEEPAGHIYEHAMRLSDWLDQNSAA